MTEVLRDTRVPRAAALDTEVDLTDPAFWVRRDAHHTVARMREAAPVQRHRSATEGPFWSVLDHATTMRVLSDDTTYVSWGGSLLGTGTAPPAGSGRMMALADGPRHRRFRDPGSGFFNAGAVRRLEPRIRELCADLIDRSLDRDFDFVTDIAAVIPMTVMCDVMDIPDGDRSEVTRLCDGAFLARSADQRRSAHQQLLTYLFDLAMRRRATPGDDLVSALAAVGGPQPALTMEEVVLNCDNIIVGGVQTVRHTAAMSLRTLIGHPAAWESLSTGAAGIATAVDELLRWTSVGVHVLRTAACDTELAGCQISEGDRVVLWIPAANRDPAVFPHANQLDLARSPNRHLALGWGPHFCIGGLLARVELRILLAELVARVSTIEQVGPAVPALSIINLGLASQPVRLTSGRSDEQ